MCTRQVYVFVRQLAVREQIGRQRSTHPETFERLHGCQQLLGAGPQQHVSQGGRRPHVAVRRHEGQTFLIHPGTAPCHLHGHMWLSVGMRAKPSSFTRAQRLATCMATLFLAMIANCMFFKTADEQTVNSEAISIGPMTLTPQQISSSLFSSLIADAQCNKLNKAIS